MRRSSLPRTIWMAIWLTVSSLTGASIGAAEADEDEPEIESEFVLFNRPKKDTPAEQLAHADQLWQDGRLKKAQKAYQALLKRWPTAEQAPDALYRQGVILQERGKLNDAFDAFQTLIDRHTGRFPYQDVLDRQFEIAVTLMEDPVGDVLFLPGFDSPERALELFEQIVENGRRTDQAAEAQFLIGQIHETTKDYELAIVAYLNTFMLYPSSEFAEKAAFARARCLVALSDRSPYDQRLAKEAWYALTVFNTTYPRSEYADDAQALGKNIFERRAQAAFEIAEYYDKTTKKNEAAIAQYQSFIESFPNSPLAERARDRIRRLTSERENQRNE